MFSWCLRKKDVVAQSTTEAEYVAAIIAKNQVIWIRKILVDLHMDQPESTQIYVDNKLQFLLKIILFFMVGLNHFKIKLYFLK